MKNIDTSYYPGMSIVILNYNGKELLKRYLPSILSACEKYSLEKIELIVVDNASSDGSTDYIKSNFPFVKLMIQPFNRKFAAANTGVFSAKNKIVISLNNDIELDKDFLFFISQHFEDKDVFAVRTGVKINLEDGINDLKNPRIGGGFRFGFFDVPKKMKKKNDFAFFGGSLAFDKEKFIQLGGFDEIFFPLYYEDVDICYRAWKRGWKIIYEPRSLLYHQGGATVSKIYSSLSMEIIAEKNRYFMVWKNITDVGLFCQHFFFIPVRIVAFLLVGRIAPLLGFFYALKAAKEVIKKRRSEKKLAKVSDRNIFNIFKE